MRDSWIQNIDTYCLEKYMSIKSESSDHLIIDS